MTGHVIVLADRREVEPDNDARLMQPGLYAALIGWPAPNGMARMPAGRPRRSSWVRRSVYAPGGGSHQPFIQHSGSPQPSNRRRAWPARARRAALPPMPRVPQNPRPKKARIGHFVVSLWCRSVIGAGLRLLGSQSSVCSVTGVPYRGWLSITSNSPERVASGWSGSLLGHSAITTGNACSRPPTRCQRRRSVAARDNTSRAPDNARAHPGAPVSDVMDP